MVKANQKADNFKQNTQTGRSGSFQGSLNLNSSSFNASETQKRKKEANKSTKPEKVAVPSSICCKNAQKSTRESKTKQVDSPICQKGKKVAASGSTWHKACK